MPSGPMRKLASAVSLGVIVASCSSHSESLVPSGGDQTASYIASHHLSSRIVKYAGGSLSVTLTPNYHAGFGTWPPALSKVPCSAVDVACAPSPGPSASLRGGVVDFGQVEDGEDYIYRYAVEITTTAGSPWYLFGTANDFSSAFSGSSLLWIPSNPRLDTNVAFAAFANVADGMEFPSPTSGIGWQYPIMTGKAGTSLNGFDYILRVPWSTPNGSASTTVGYTVVPQ